MLKNLMWNLVGILVSLPIVFLGLGIITMMVCMMIEIFTGIDVIREYIRPLFR